ncbi:hypothetical protein HPB52_012025 [Rhipicephalus sanguineus]|uniref:Uncharacterized protein n=1 Tax=Rhipicephalus sanguineus TaxID=34632 RepID=A0A9D4SS95_RHISA|nr:hypothetical protein HPB52_012025 [Rhipicephalus sanguineus]
MRRSLESTVSKSGSPILSGAPSPSPWQAVDGSADVVTPYAASSTRNFLLNQDAPQFTRDLAIYENPTENVAHRESWSNTKKALIVVAVFLCASLLFVSVLIGRRLSASGPEMLCSSSACRDYSDSLKTSINTSVDPCRSFTHFVCDGWERDNVISVRQHQFAEVVERVRDFAFAMEIPVKGQNETQMAAALYRSCDDVVHGRSDQLALVTELLRGANITWPEVPEGPCDLLHTLLYTSLRLGWDAVVTFTISRTPLEDALVVKPGSSFPFVYDKTVGFETEEGKRVYFNELMRAFRGDRRNVTARIVSYEDTIAVENMALGKLAQVYSVSERNGTLSRAQEFVDAPDAGLSEARWTAALSRFRINLTGGLNVATRSPSYVKTFVSLWAALGEAGMYSFVSWCTVQVAALYTNRELILNYYDKDSRKAQVYSDAFCVSRAMIMSNAALFAPYTTQVLRSDAMVDAREVTLSVRSAFRDRLEAWPHYEENVTVVSNWASLDAPFRTFAPAEIDRFARGPLVDMDVGSLAHNWVVLAASLTDTPMEDVASELYAVYKFRYHVLPRGEGDFQLMPYALRFPMYEGSLPAAVNYGGLGAVVGRALGGLFLDAYRRYGDPASATALADARSCLIRGQFGAVDSIEDLLAEAFGVSALVAAYKLTATADNAVEGMEAYSSMQMLFIAMCHNKCQGSMRGNKDPVCNALLQYVPEFADAFRCQAGAPMNPSHRCRFL